MSSYQINEEEMDRLCSAMEMLSIKERVETDFVFESMSTRMEDMGIDSKTTEDMKVDWEIDDDMEDMEVDWKEGDMEVDWKEEDMEVDDWWKCEDATEVSSMGVDWEQEEEMDVSAMEVD